MADLTYSDISESGKRGLINPSIMKDIADAIRFKTNDDTSLIPSQMAAKIRDISASVDQSKISYSITNENVSAFISAARSAYANNDNISIADTYKEVGTAPTNTSVPASGTVEVIYSDGKTVLETASGSYTLKHFSPKGGRVSLLGSNGETKWSRIVQPTGSVRFLDLNVTRNARDLGGWPCDGGTVRYGMLYRMTVPNAQDADTLLNRLGISHQFDLRGTGASESNNFPIPHYHKYGGYVQYTKVIPTSVGYDTILRQIIEDVIDATVVGEPLLFHCSMGCDRTGTLAFYLEGILGMSDIDIDIEYELSSLFDDKVANQNYYYRYRTDNRVTNETDWVGLKNLVSGYSGSTISARIINYMLSIGISAARLNAFRAAMIDGTPSNITAPTCSVTNTLTGCSTNNTAATAEMQQPYYAEITANTGYKLDGATVSITMGGTDITASAYSNGIISISSVTGNIVIQVVAAEIPSYTNQIPISTDTNGNVFNSTGYKSGYRLNSSGEEVSYSGYVVTGFMPFVLGQKILFDKFSGSESSNGGIFFYDSSYTILASNKVNTLISDGNLVKGQILEYTPASPIHDSGSGNMKSIENVAYIRIAAQSSNPSALSCGIIGDAPQTTIYSITNTLTNCSTSNNVASIKSNQSYAATITANSGYTLSGASVSVTMGGVDVTSSVYNNGAISIADVTGNVVIHVTAVAKSTTTYSVQNTLTNCSTNNNKNTVESGQSYTATITANSGYTLDGAIISISMAGADITDSVYSNGMISIPSVTGNIVINISAAQESQLKELFDPSVATLNQRFSSSGSYSALNGNFCSDFIPVSGLDEQEPWRIYIKENGNISRFRAAGNNESVLFCKSDKTIINSNYGRLTINTNTSGTNTLCKHSDSNGGVYIDINQTGDGNYIPSTFFDLSQVAYIRVCMTYSSGTEISDMATLTNVSITADKIVDGGASELVNLFDSNDADVSLRCRINSSGSAVAYADNQLVTGYIQAAVGDTFIIKTDKSLKTNSYTGMVGGYDSNKAYIAQCTNTYSAVWTISDDGLTGTCVIPSIVNGKSWSNTVYVRFCIAYTDIANIEIYKQ